MLAGDLPAQVADVLSGGLVDDAFSLNSKPGAAHTIYLDFDGYTTSETLWNVFYNAGGNIVTPPFSTDGSDAFSTSELQRIEAIWARVAEDFLPFNVNVTTQDPGAAALKKTSSSDTQWGIRVVVGGNNAWYGNAGGVAFVGSFNWDTDTPVFIFEDLVGNGHEKYTAEAISHEVGHALGLSHDGYSGGEYYSGDSSWAPIMGTGYYSAVTQWSSGEYSGASNTENDIQIIATQNGFGYRTDDYGNTLSSAAPLTNLSGVISTRTDRDVFSFTTGGAVNITVNPAARGPNLNILAEILDASGNVVLSANPSGLGASIATVLAPGDYYLRIDGVGDAAAGYSDYGSLGFYSVTADIEPAGVPLEPASMSVSKNRLYVNESGTTDSFTLVLGSRPTSNVVITARSTALSEAVIDKTTLVFTPENWNIPQTITATGVADASLDGDKTFFIRATATSLDARYNGFAVPIVRVTNSDSVVTDPVAPASVNVSTNWLYVNESGTTDTLSVVLGSQPTSNVVITPRSTALSEGVLNKTSLIFTPSNWNIPQTITVKGVADGIADGDKTFFLKATASSLDARYDGIAFPTVRVKNFDSVGTEVVAAAAVNVSTNWLYISESGAADSLSVVLNSKPASNVTLAARSTHVGEGVIDKTALVFTPSNWNIPQTITITGVDDSYFDGDKVFFLKLEAVSTDANYDGISVPTVRAKNADNEGAAPATLHTSPRDPLFDPSLFTMPDGTPPPVTARNLQQIDLFFQELPEGEEIHVEADYWEFFDLNADLAAV
ncbi:MAG: hypothetical protein WEB58_18010 [Planctomycetaceae bacterium]